jgi:hypothetical protein
MARTKGGRKRGSRRLEFQSYIFRVENPEVSYGLSIDRKGVTEGPYWEHLELSVLGTIVSPEKVQGRQGTLTFLADRRITRDLDNPIEQPTNSRGHADDLGRNDKLSGLAATRRALAYSRAPDSR